MIKMILEHVSNSVKGSRHKFGWLFFQVFTVPILLPNKEKLIKELFIGQNEQEKLHTYTLLCILLQKHEKCTHSRCEKSRKDAINLVISFLNFFVWIIISYFQLIIYDVLQVCLLKLRKNFTTRYRAQCRETCKCIYLTVDSHNPFIYLASHTYRLLTQVRCFNRSSIFLMFTQWYFIWCLSHTGCTQTVHSEQCTFWDCLLKVSQCIISVYALLPFIDVSQQESVSDFLTVASPCCEVDIHLQLLEFRTPLDTICHSSESVIKNYYI